MNFELQPRPGCLQPAKVNPGLRTLPAWGIISPSPSGRGSARLERTVRVREVGGSNPPAPTVILTAAICFNHQYTDPAKDNRVWIHETG